MLTRRGLAFRRGWDVVRDRLRSLFGRRTAPVVESAPSGPPKRAVIFTRYRGPEVEAGVDEPSVQGQRCRALAARRGYVVVDVFHDAVADPDQPRGELRRLRAALWRGGFDVVLATRADRLYFDLDRLVRFSREAASFGVGLELVDEPRLLERLADRE